MFDRLDAQHTSLPPPRNARARRDALWPRVHRVGPAAAFAGTLIMVVLAVASALTLLATTATSIAVPLTLSLVGGLIAVSLVIRSRSALTRGAHLGTARSHSADEGTKPRARRVRSAREDRTMLLQAGRGESWRR